LREYSFQATDDTVTALRLLRAAWAGFRITPAGFAVRLADGTEVRIGVNGAELEPELEAFRISANHVPARVPDAPSITDAAVREATGFTNGGNDIVLFTGATWIEGPADLVATRGDGGDGAGTPRPLLGPGAVMQFSGNPQQIPETATAVCLTTDAIVVASPLGTGFLMRTGLRPYSLDVTADKGEIARFLTERGYTDE
jgi:hypothetical protein